MKKYMKEIKEKSDTALLSDVREAREALRVFRFKAAGASVRNNKEGVVLRKKIARMLTEKNARARVAEA